MRVTLGGLELRDFEKPDLIQLGGKQTLAVREFPGGNWSIQDFGPTYRPIAWSGMFVGTDAYDRMMTVGLMRTAGKPVELTTDKFTMLVVIEEFNPDYKNNQRIPFNITIRRVLQKQSTTLPVADAVDKAATLVASQTAPAEKPRTYTVKSGDTLSRIAANQLGDANDWEKIYSNNQNVLKDGPHKIYPGMKLVINSA